MTESFPDDQKYEEELNIRYIQDYETISNLLDTHKIDEIIQNHVYYDESTMTAMFMIALANKINKPILTFLDFKEALIQSLKYPSHLKSILKLPAKLEDIYHCAKERIYLDCMAYLVANLVSYDEIIKFELSEFGLPESWDFDFPGNKQSVIERAFMLGIKEDVTELNDEIINKHSKIYRTDFATMKVICDNNYGYIAKFQSIRDSIPRKLLRYLHLSLVN
jgi:hypothetical protein